MSAPAPSAAPRTSSWLRGAGWLALATLLVSAGNYVFSLVLARVLAPASFVDFAAVQSLLLVAGTGVMAAVPWVVARQVVLARAAGDEEGVRESLAFGLGAAAAQAVPVAVVAGLLGWHLGGAALGTVAAVAGVALSLVAAPVGFLQGEDRFGAIAALRLAEAAVRVLVGLLLALVLTGSPVGALVGFPVGSAVLVLAGLWLCRRGFPLRRPRAGQVPVLLRQAAWLGAIQVVLTLLGAVDTIVAAAAGLSPDDAYAYQVAALLGRVPLFLSVAVAQALFPSLGAARDDAAVAHELRRGLALFLRVCAVVAVAAWTVPLPVLALVAPQGTEQVAELVRVTTVTGVVVGLLNVLTTAHQARGRFGAALRVLVPFAVLQPAALLVAGRLGALPFALVSAVVVSALAALLLARSRPWWWTGSFAVGARGLGVAALAAAVVVAVVAVGRAGGPAATAAWVLGCAAVALLAAAPFLPVGVRRRARRGEDSS